MSEKPKPNQPQPDAKQRRAEGKVVRGTPQSPGGLRGRRLWLMRLAAATLVPLLILTAVEVGLRIVGYGYPTDYFLPSRISGNNFLIPNSRFGYRFFPPALARDPLPLRLPVPKPANTYRIFLFGESAALGDPDPGYGVGRYLQHLLNERYPAVNFEVVCVAMVAINSHAILPIARQCAGLEGDLWIVYMGNNEMIGAYGPGTVFSTKAPSLATVRTILAAKATRTGQLLDHVLSGLQADGATPQSWEGVDMFSKNRLAYHDRGRLQAYENFRGNLADILRVADRAGVPVILSTVASNLRDCAPFASLHKPGLAASPLAAWEKSYQAGIGWETAGDYQAALNSYSNAAAIDPEFAELQFRLGNCHLALTNPTAAREAYERARDYDALSLRADSRLNRIIKDSLPPQGNARVTLVDAARILANDSPDGILGKELFYEHVHYTAAGNYLLARIFAGTVKEWLPASATATGGAHWAEADFCDQRLALTSWDQHRLWHGILGQISKPPFTAQASHRQNTNYCEAQRREIIARIGPETPAQDRQLYEAAILRSPEDNLLYSRFAQYLEAMGSRAEAIAACQRVCELLPDLEWPLYHLGDLLVRAGRMSEAAATFKRALAIRSDFAQARKELERIQASHPYAAGSGR